MGVAKRDVSGVFHEDLKVKRSAGAAPLFDLNRRGLTFVTDRMLNEWTEMSVKLQLPTGGAAKRAAIHCRAVVVQCEKREGRKGYEVSLLFLDLPKRDEERLELMRPAGGISRVSISR